MAGLRQRLGRAAGSAGFTLVELAIVMTIIGLLIGGTLKGQSMIQNARITSTIAQVDSYTAATTQFRDQYSQWPGDMANALQRLPNCTPQNNCANGNANGIIGQVIGNYSIEDQPDQAAGGDAQAMETVQFWKHLALADLITGISPSADPSVPETGQTHPAAKFAGAISVSHGVSIGVGPVLGARTAFLLRRGLTGPLDYGPGSNMLTPDVAEKLDRKADDGNALSGWITAGGGGELCRGPIVANDGRYRIENGGHHCFLAISFTNRFR